jgi:hypothetical protein
MAAAGASRPPRRSRRITGLPALIAAGTVGQATPSVRSPLVSDRFHLTGPLAAVKGGKDAHGNPRRCAAVRIGRSLNAVSGPWFVMLFKVQVRCLRPPSGLDWPVGAEGGPTDRRLADRKGNESLSSALRGTGTPDYPVCLHPARKVAGEAYATPFFSLGGILRNRQVVLDVCPVGKPSAELPVVQYQSQADDGGHEDQAHD